MDTGTASASRSAFGPPRELPAARGLVRRLIEAAWIVCFLFAVGIQIAATGLYVERTTRVDPAFAALGLTLAGTDRAHVAVAPLNDDEGYAPWIAVIRSIDGRDVSDLPPEALADRLRGPDGSVVLGMADAETGEPATRTLTRSDANRPAVYAEDHRIFGMISAVLDAAVALVLIGGGVLLRTRRFDRPVSMLFSFALLLLGTVGTTIFWDRLSWPAGETIVDAVWLCLLLIGIPALPSGRYTPPWTRWVLVLAPLGAVAMAASSGVAPLSEPARMALLGAAFACVILRFRYTPKGPERQQLKWASLGLAAGLILYLVSVIAHLIWESSRVGPIITVSYYVEYIAHRIAFMTMGVGVLIALMNYRLNDADAAIGRSTGYALVTAGIAVVWAFCAAWIDTTLILLTGASNPTLATALSTLAAMAILTPAQKRILTWMEKRFQRALVRLRDLPGRLARLKHHQDRLAVAAAALSGIVVGVIATRAAIVDSEGALVLAATGIEPEAVLADFPRDGDDRVMGVRYPLRDLDDNVGWLLLGPRSDGASYNGDERRALHSILDPLADAIRLTRRRKDELAALADVIAAMEARVAKVEAGRGPARSRNPRRPG